MKETIATVRAAFQEQKDAITELDAALAKELKQLKVGAFRAGRKLTAAEVSRRKEIAVTRRDLGEALSDLGLDTLDALDNASDLDDLLDEIKAVNSQLEDDLERLKSIEHHAEIVANVAAMAERAVTILAGLRL